MEHQTMTTFGAYTTPLVAHELGHQWWGDCVTYASWLDIWMSEGWASYTEQLFVERFWGVAAAHSYRSNVFNRVMGAAGGTVYVSDTTDVYRVFDSRLTYDKGAAVAHMLRYVAPSEAAFFNGLKAYQQQYAYRTATTDSFRKVMEGAYGRPLDTFFNQWIYKAGYPTYGGTWNQRGSDVYVQLVQSTSVPSSVAAFAMPLALQLKSTSGDTVVKVYCNSNKQTYHFKWDREMIDLAVDPNDDIVNGQSLISNDPMLGVSVINNGILSIFPNPASEAWRISGLIKGSMLKLIDAMGKTVWQQENALATVDINARSLPSGIYTLQVQSPDSAVASFKLEKR
jgi:aminopeptidase N